MNFHEFKIVTDEESRSKHIFIDGIEQKGVISCDIRLRPDEIPTVKLEYMIGHLDTAIAASVVETSKMQENQTAWDDYDRCYECRGLGDDYRVEGEDLVSNCDTCPFGHYIYRRDD